MDDARTEMLELVRRQLAIDMNCSPEDFMRDGTLFTESTLHPNRRMFDRQIPFLEAATMGKGIVITGDPVLLSRAKPHLEGKSRDDLFSAPFLYGHSLYYLLATDSAPVLPYPEGIRLEVRSEVEIHSLYAVRGFENAIQYDVAHPRPDALVLSAYKGDTIIGMAGASADCEQMWQIGIDVLPPFRGLGLAACLVSRLAQLILEKGKTPYYGTSSSNIASQSVAYRSGFMPAWMCTYRHALDGKTPYGDLGIVVG